MWIAVRQRFSAFYNELALRGDDLEDGCKKAERIWNKLDSVYYTLPMGHRQIIGSWGRGTAAHRSNDIDILFVLPPSVKARFDQHVYNGQSALLQEIKGHLLDLSPRTDIRGSGPVVQLQYNSITVELVPAFRRTDGQQGYWVPNTAQGGNWKPFDPDQEAALLDLYNKSAAFNIKPMVKMLKAWKRNCNVPMKSFLLEQVVREFMADYNYSQYDFYWYDWFFRDFFQHLCARAGHYLIVSNDGSFVPLGDAWLSRADTAKNRAILACQYERDDLVIHAGEEWQKIFGNQVPIRP